MWFARSRFTGRRAVVNMKLFARSLGPKLRTSKRYEASLFMRGSLVG